MKWISCLPWQIDQDRLTSDVLSMLPVSPCKIGLVWWIECTLLREILVARALICFAHTYKLMLCFWLTSRRTLEDSMLIHCKSSSKSSRHARGQDSTLYASKEKCVCCQRGLLRHLGRSNGLIMQYPTGPKVLFWIDWTPVWCSSKRVGG